MKTYIAEDGTELFEFRCGSCFTDDRDLEPPHKRCYYSEYVNNGRTACTNQSAQADCMRSARADGQSVIFVTKLQLVLLTMLHGDKV